MRDDTVVCAKDASNRVLTLFDIPVDVVDILHERPRLGVSGGPKEKPPGFRIDVLSTTDTHEVKRYCYGDLAICDVIRLNAPRPGDIEKAAGCLLGDGVHRCLSAHLAVARNEAFHYINALYVETGVRHNGIGRKLLGFVLNQIGPNWVWLCSNPLETTDLARDRMYEFYEDFGFRRFHVASCMMSLTPQYITGGTYREKSSPGHLDPVKPPRLHPWDKDVRTLAVSTCRSEPDFRMIREVLLKVFDGEDPGITLSENVEARLDLPKGTIQKLKAARINVIVDTLKKSQAEGDHKDVPLVGQESSGVQGLKT